MSHFALQNARQQVTTGARIEELASGSWRLSIPAGPSGIYRLAQLDDYGSLPRRKLPDQAPYSLDFWARASSASLPGTWGFGLWNDPFSMGMLGPEKNLRLPTLPDAVWFFFASPPNYLTLRDDLPANGQMAAVFSSHASPFSLAALGILALPGLLLPPAMRAARRLASRLVHQDSAALEFDPTRWRHYELAWEARAVRLSVDGATVLNSRLSPQGRLGFVLWLDNQAAALLPNGRFLYKMLPNPEAAWIEVSQRQPDAQPL